MRAIAVFTETGATARLISKYRPGAQIYAFSVRPEVSHRCHLFWGVHPVGTPRVLGVDEMVRTAEQELLRRRAVEPGDILGVVAGTRMASGSTNFMRLHVVGGDRKK